MQKDIDSIVGTKPSSEWTYMSEFSRLYNSMVGAVLNEELRLMPVVETIPKLTVGNQKVVVDGEEFLVPNGTFIHLNTVGTNRNPKYWPHEKVKGGGTNLNDFVPQRWLVSRSEKKIGENRVSKEERLIDTGEEKNPQEDSSPLFKPAKGAFISFGEGHRACPGRKFALVEMTAVLAVIFQQYSVELDVLKWATDEEVTDMGDLELEGVYDHAIKETNEVLRRCNQAQIVLKMAKEDKVPLRFVKRGSERFKKLWQDKA